MTKNKSHNIALPDYAKLPINRCNLPAEVLGDLSFQSNPKPIFIDGIAQLYKSLFRELDNLPNAELRSTLFTQYMSAYFRLDSLEDAGYNATISVDRSRANYMRVLRGWYFDSDSLEGAMIKSWVESRFGLIPRYHQGAIRSTDDKAYAQFVTYRSRGLYNTNALEAQLDLLYSYCQYELFRRYTEQNAFTLYRGLNRLNSLEQIPTQENNNGNALTRKVLLNNISSFTSDPVRADEFGDVVISNKVPFPKLLFFSGLMPGIMTTEREFVVIGGVYSVNILKEIILK